MGWITRWHLSFTPIPALVAIMAILHLVVKPSLFYEPSWLLPITNAVFITVVFFIVAYIAMKTYRTTGRIQILLLGCGVLAFGIGALVAGFVRSFPKTGADLNVIIYNTGALIGAAFHFAAAIILLMNISPVVRAERKEFWLVIGYGGLTVFLTLFAISGLRGMIPHFFIQGVGPTVLRQWVLGSSDFLFTFSFIIFMGLYLKNREGFLYWYSLALALTSISLTAFLIQNAVGSPIGWVGRFSQYLGGIYFLTAVITAMRSAQVRRISFDEVLTASLSPVEEKFRALAEHSPDMIQRFDREMKHIYVNRAGLRLYSKPSGSIIRKTIEEVGLPVPYASLLKEKIQRVLETNQPVEVEHYISTENGTRFYHSHCIPEYGADGAVVNVLVVSRDLTARKETEEALRQSEEDLNFAQAVAKTGSWRLDVRRNILQWSDETYRIFGVPKASPITYDTFLGFVHPEDREYVHEKWIAALGGKPYDLEHRIVMGGKVKWVRERALLEFDESGELFGGFGTVQDITERKQAEEQIRKLNEGLTRRARELENANKDLDAFASMVAHDLKNQMIIISTLIDRLNKQQERLDAKGQEYLGFVKESIRTMASIVDGLLEMSRISRKELKKEKVDLSNLARSILKKYREKDVERQVELVIPEKMEAEGDGRLLEVALGNLLGNAWKFTKHTHPARIEIGLNNESGETVFYIRDNGCGFDCSENQEKVFVPFQRFHSSEEYPGTGLGLATVKRILDRHGGRIWVESEVGKGTTFYSSFGDEDFIK